MKRGREEPGQALGALSPTRDSQPHRTRVGPALLAHRLPAGRRKTSRQGRPPTAPRLVTPWENSLLRCITADGCDDAARPVISSSHLALTHGTSAPLGLWTGPRNQLTEAQVCRASGRQVMSGWSQDGPCGLVLGHLVVSALPQAPQMQGCPGNPGGATRQSCFCVGSGPAFRTHGSTLVTQAQGVSLGLVGGHPRPGMHGDFRSQKSGLCQQAPHCLCGQPRPGAPFQVKGPFPKSKLPDNHTGQSCLLLDPFPHRRPPKG